MDLLYNYLLYIFNLIIFLIKYELNLIYKIFISQRILNVLNILCYL
jgi:hypothetical protein